MNIFIDPINYKVNNIVVNLAGNKYLNITKKVYQASIL